MYLCISQFDFIGHRKNSLRLSHLIKAIFRSQLDDLCNSIFCPTVAEKTTTKISNEGRPFIKVRARHNLMPHICHNISLFFNLPLLRNLRDKFAKIEVIFSRIGKISEAPTVFCLIDCLWSILLVYFSTKTRLVWYLTCFLSCFYNSAHFAEVQQANHDQ